MREQFEKLPEIEQGLRHCHYDESTNIYHADAAHVEEFEWHTQFVNGAWYAYQEQQNKLNGALDLACKLQYSNGERIYNEIKELLK